MPFTIQKFNSLNVWVATKTKNAPTQKRWQKNASTCDSSEMTSFDFFSKQIIYSMSVVKTKLLGLISSLSLDLKLLRRLILIIALFIIILLAGLVDVALELAGSGLQTVQLIAMQWHFHAGGGGGTSPSKSYLGPQI